MAYADYEFYVNEIIGTTDDYSDMLDKLAIQKGDFPRLANKASDFIDYYTRNKAKSVTDEDILTALGKACCAIAEAMYATEQTKAIAAKQAAAALSSANPELKSESVGSWSVSYATSGDYGSLTGVDAVKAERAGYAQIALEYLAHTGLLYRGGC